MPVIFAVRLRWTWLSIANRDNYSTCRHLIVAGADCKKIKKYNEQKIQHVLSLIDSQGDISNLWVWGNTWHI